VRLKAALCGMSGRLAEGRRLVDRLLVVNPGTTVATVRAHYAPRLRGNTHVLESMLGGLRKAGLPDGPPSRQDRPRLRSI
jgi:hypothetical protein